jgi:DNA processing protein
MCEQDSFMDDSERCAWLRFMHVRGVTPQVKLALLRKFAGSGQDMVAGPYKILGLSDAELRPHLPNATAIRALRQDMDIGADLRWLDAPNRFLLPWCDKRYPPDLREIPDPPLGLYVAGHPEALEGPSLAIVGSRRPTPGGITVTRQLAGGISQAGLSVVSGLALGIDGCAHQAALEQGARTVAVMGTGPEQVYPARHRHLAGEILANGGALISELPVGIPPKKENFPKRNRIISGLSLGVLVVEAARRSGSLVTARLAAEQNREVFAVPGSVLSPMSRGSNDLIHSGAAMTRSVNDILIELEPRLRHHLALAGVPGQADSVGDNQGQLPLLESVGFDPITVDHLIETSGLTAGQVSSMLLSLEIDGWLARGADGTVVRIK